MKLCAEPGCQALTTNTRCPHHTRTTGQITRARYPRNRYGPHWETIRRQVLKRDGHTCRWTHPDGTRCTTPATDIDHIIPFAYFPNRAAANELANLQALCAHHHGIKTAHEVRSRQTTPTPTRDRANW